MPVGLTAAEDYWAGHAEPGDYAVDHSLLDDYDPTLRIRIDPRQPLSGVRQVQITQPDSRGPDMLPVAADTVGSQTGP